MPYHRPFDEQRAFFQQKLNLPTERWDDIRHEEHDRSFIVAGAQGADLLDDLNAAVTRAIRDGTGLQAFQKAFKEIVQRHGWTGWTGEGSKAGEAWRTKVIYQTNLSTAYAAGRYQQLTDPELLSVLPYWQYRHADGVMHPRPLHVSWDGLTLPPDHPFWKTHFAPNGWGCHCRIIAVSKRDYLQAIADGKGPANAPEDGNVDGIDPGFAYTPGASVADELRALVQGKQATLPAPLWQALAEEAKTVLAGGREGWRPVLDAVAERIAGASVEHLILLAPDGRELLRKVGTGEAVELSPDELKLLPDQVMLHNHPGLPQSFSLEDVQLAIWHRLSEMHVVDRLYRYLLVRPPGASWGPAYWVRTVLPVWTRVQEDVVNRLEEAVSRGLLRADERDALREHMIWEEVDAELGIGYTRMLRKDLER